MSASNNLKIIIVGNGQVGKTSLAIKFCNDTFSSKYKKTLGVDYLTKMKFIKELKREVTYCIWDTAGQECYYSLTRRYYKGADIALIVFATNDRMSFNQIGLWYDKVISECDRIPIILIMSKIDLSKSNDAAVTETEARQFAQSMGLDLILCSSKTGTMVNELFESIAIKYYLNLYLKQTQQQQYNKVYNEYNEENSNINNDDRHLVAITHKTFKLKIAKNNNSNRNSNQSNHKKTCC